MTEYLRVQNVKPSGEFDALIVALGFEARSGHVAGQFHMRANRKIAFSFESEGEHSFDANDQFMRGNGFEVLPLGTDFTERLDEILGSLGREDVSVAIDISSFTKFHLAQIIDALRTHGPSGLAVDFLYSPASSSGWQTHGDPIQVAEPIHPAFASWSDDPSWPLTAIIGLGVEENLALGVAEHLDVSSVYAFSPSGDDQRFKQLGTAANSAFFSTDYVVRTSVYDLEDPFDLFSRLESLVYGLRPDSRVAIIPLGPKIFALCALLTSVASDRATTVWRFSSGSGLSYSDVTAAGPIVTLHVDFLPDALPTGVDFEGTDN